MPSDGRRISRLKRTLERLYGAFGPEFLPTDPLEFVHRYTEPLDMEIAGLIASGLAYGRVEGIKRSVARVLDVMGKSPSGFVMGFAPERDGRVFSGFVHRFTRGRDISALLFYLRQMIEEAGSIKGFFLKGYSPDDENIKASLHSFAARALKLDASPFYGKGELPRGAGVRFFFPSPMDGSQCKRLNLYLRWMVRREGVDLGLWREVDPAMLVMPLDTHVARICGNIGLTGRKNADSPDCPNWKMAEEITRALKLLDPADPVKYDFALCRLGILDKCPRRLDPTRCKTCLIRDFCVL
jgi:uncharacterized protein (TIGR02757 family)